MTELGRPVAPRMVYGIGIGLLALALATPVGALAWRFQRSVPAGEPEALRPEMVRLPGGTFDMGSPESEPGRDGDETLHTVTVSSFWISRTEVTQAQFEAAMGRNPAVSEVKGCRILEGIDAAGSALPVVCVSWLNAVAYANRVSELESLVPAYRVLGDEVTWDRDATGYRLPTEAEWEYAARAEARTRFVGTDEKAQVCARENVADLALRDVVALGAGSIFDCRDGFAGPAPAGSRVPNGFQLWDMGGNVSEWVWDWLSEYEHRPAPNPIGPPSGSSRRIRGADWNDSPQIARVASRFWGVPSRRYQYVGIRLARSARP